MMMTFARILVVDDSKVTRKIIRQMLESHSYCNIDEAANGEEALSLLDRRTYSLVVSDWNMVPVSGLDLLIAIRKSPRLAKMPFIMATARSQRHFASIARDSGATHYVEKPFTAETLLARVHSVF